MRPLNVILAACVWLTRAGAEVVVYSAPEGESLSTDYEIVAGGKPVDVSRARVLDPPFAGKEYDYGGPYSFANFDVSGPVEVRITSKKPLANLMVRPAVPGVRTVVENDNTVLLSLPGPCKLSIEPEGKKGPLLLFANAIEENPPKEGDAGVVFYGPGVHQAGRIVVTNNQTLYLAGGAVVKGGVVVQGENIRIAGRGILDGSDWEWRKGPTPHVVSIRGTNVDVSGITIRGASHWTIVPRDSRNITVRGVKICGSRVQNDDGINPCNTQDMLITDCFIRSDDDCIALKGLSLESPNNNVERITVENSTLWCDRARIFLLGHESRAEFMRDITLRNLDIIHFTMTAFLFEPGEEMRLENVLVEDIRVYGEGQRELIRLKPVVNQYMRKKVPGHIANNRFRNITVSGKEGPYLVQISGADEQHAVKGVAFDNVVVLGEGLAPASRRLQVGQQVSGLSFAGERPVLTLSEQQPDGEFPGWHSFHEKPGARTADVWKLNADGVLVCQGTPRGYLYSEREFKDCFVRFAWRYPAGTTNANGGVLVRMTGEHAIWPKCLEFQLNLGQAGDFWAIRDYLFTGPADDLKTMNHAQFGTLRHLKRSVTAENPPGEWNVFEGRVDGQRVTQIVNGTTVNVATGCEIVPGMILVTSEGQEIHLKDFRVYSK